MIVRNKETDELFITHDTHACAKDEKMVESKPASYFGLQSTIEQTAVTHNEH